jgi:hypothetical protein
LILSLALLFFFRRAAPQAEFVVLLNMLTPLLATLIMSFVVTRDGLRGNSRLSLGPVGDLRTATTLPGVAGLHIMAVHWTEAVPEIVTRSGLFPRPVLRA